MSLTLQIFLAGIIGVFLLIIIWLLRNDILSMKYSLLWLSAGAVLLLMVAFPDISNCIAAWIGIEITSNLVFMAEGVFVLLMLISLTAIVSKQSSRILRLIQTIAILEKRMNELEKENEKVNE